MEAFRSLIIHFLKANHLSKTPLKKYEGNTFHLYFIVTGLKQPNRHFKWIAKPTVNTCMRTIGGFVTPFSTIRHKR